MSNSQLVDPQGWEYDLQSVYSAYMGHFQLHNISWHDQAWGQLFETFEQFLAFSWPVVTVTDARTGRAHIVTRMTSINAFLKMIKTRFGETLPQVDNMLLVTPIETSQRHLRYVDDWSTYKKIHSALPAVALAALKARVRGGDPHAIRELWSMRDKTFLAIDFECSERNSRSCVELGYAAIRSSHLEAAGAWPPVPDTNYRKGHYIVSEYASMFNKASSSLPSQYAFGESQVVPKAKMPLVIQSILSGLASPDSETVANSVVLVGHGIQAIMQHLEQMQIQLPNNMLILDIAYLERALFVTGERGPMVDRKSGRGRMPESLLSLGALLRSFEIEPPCALHNAGNDAFMALVVFQKMADPRKPIAAPKGVQNRTGKGEAQGGNGHIRRAANAAARIFRPLGGTHSELGRNGNGSRNGNVNGSGNGSVSQVRVGRRSGDGVDEMGMNVHMKRASMFSTLTSPMMVPADKSKKGTNTGSANGSGRWLSPPPSSSSVLPGKRRHSVMHLRSVVEGVKGG